MGTVVSFRCHLSILVTRWLFAANVIWWTHWLHLCGALF